MPHTAWHVGASKRHAGTGLPRLRPLPQRLLLAHAVPFVAEVVLVAKASAVAVLAPGSVYPSWPEGTSGPLFVGLLNMCVLPAVCELGQDEACSRLGGRGHMCTGAGPWDMSHVSRP